MPHKDPEKEKEYQRNYRRNHRSKFREYRKKAYYKDVEKSRARSKEKYLKTRDYYIKYRREYSIKHAASELCRKREQNKRVRYKVLSHYSNGIPFCNSCGNTDLHVLTIDHINDDGAEQRREIRVFGIAYLYWIIRNNYPVNLQVLCMNCQWIKRHNLRNQEFQKELDSLLLSKGQIEVTNRIQSRERNIKLRNEMLSYYSNSDVPKCKLCGNNDARVLTFSHIDNDGTKVKKQMNGFGTSYLYWLRRNKPNNLQVLCMNCQWRRRTEHHEKAYNKKMCELKEE